MLDWRLRKEVISRGKPGPGNVLWFGEQNLGSVFGEEEIETVTNVLRESAHWSVGFGPKPKEIEEFD